MENPYKANVPPGGLTTIQRARNAIEAAICLIENEACRVGGPRVGGLYYISAMLGDALDDSRKEEPTP